MSAPIITYPFDPVYVVTNRRFGTFGVSWTAVEWLRVRRHPLARRTRRRRRDSHLNAIDRRDPLLIACIEAIGDAANGEGADLLVEELIPTIRIYNRNGLETAAA